MWVRFSRAPRTSFVLTIFVAWLRLRRMRVVDENCLFDKFNKRQNGLCINVKDNYRAHYFESKYIHMRIDYVKLY